MSKETYLVHLSSASVKRTNFLTSVIRMKRGNLSASIESHKREAGILLKAILGALRFNPLVPKGSPFDE